MKRFLTIALFALVLGIGFQQELQAADGDIELYPYDQEACLNAEPECMNTKVGDSHWALSFNGSNYHAVRSNVRYLSGLTDDNADGNLDPLELPVVGWGSFGLITFNNTALPVVLDTANNRADLTSNAQYQQVYFDANGDIAMFEDSVYTYYIFNDGTVLVPDWRLATQAEIDTYEALPDQAAKDALLTTRLTNIRIAVDAVDTDGYVLEPIKYLGWVNADVDIVADPDVTHWSTIIAGDPNDVYLGAGYTSVGFAYWDRAGNTKIVDWIKAMPAALAAEADAMETVYVDQPGWFNNLTAHDDDAVTPGVNIVVEYNGTFDLPNDVVAEWRDMFNATGDIVNGLETLDYSVVISQEGTDLETIDFVWDGTSAYVPSAAVTEVDSSDFGAGYTATYMVTTPEGDMYERTADIVIGVMPPTFSDVEDKYIDQGTYIDLRDGFTADDGYGNDVTSTVVVTAPADFNTYSPLPGSYTIDLEFTHHVHYDGIDPLIYLDGAPFVFDGSFDPDPIADWDSTIAIYTDVAKLQANTNGWGSSGVIIEVAGDGTVIRTVNRHTWALVDVNGINTPANAQGMFDAWLAGLTLEQDGFVIIVGYKLGAVYTAAGALAFGDPIDYDLTQVPVFDYDIVTEDSFMVTVDDTVAPQALVLDNEYTVYAGEFASANEAILANVVAFDFYDAPEDLAMFVSDNGGTLINIPGTTYEVEVTVEDVAGNATVVAFEITIVPMPEAAITQDDLDDAIAAANAETQALLDAQTITQAEIQALLDAQVMTDAQVQALIDSGIALIPETGCGSSMALGSSLVLLIGILSGAGLFFIKRR